MALKVGNFNGRVSGGALTTSLSGTVGYQIQIEYEDSDDGSIAETWFTIWLTEKTREMAARSFAALGLTEKQLREPGFLDAEAGDVITGREIAFSTKEETYKGKSSIKVTGIREKNDALGVSPSEAAARFFGFTPKPGEPATVEPELKDDPFESFK